MAEPIPNRPGGERGLPPGTCDTHMHFYHDRYPVAARALLRPPPATVEDYRRLQGELGMSRVVVVQPTTYGFDNNCQLEAMARLGSEARGVVVVDGTVTEVELARLTARGVRGARFHMMPGGAVDWDQLEPVADRICRFGWHIQLQLNGRELADHLERLLALSDRPVDLVVDHVGRFTPPVAPSHPSFQALCRLLDEGRTWVKLSAPYESSASGAPHYDDVQPAVEALVERYPDRLLWATNWPHPGQHDPPAPAQLRDLLDRWIPDRHRRRILVDNPARLYGFGS